MRFNEIANAEDQLALWKLVSDKMWAAFGQHAPQTSNQFQTQQVTQVKSPVVAKAVTRSPSQKPMKGKFASVKVQKIRKPPRVPTPKQLPKPKPHEPTPSQVRHTQTQQTQQLAQQIHQAMLKKHPGPSNLSPPLATPKSPNILPAVPMNNSYNEHDMDESVFHSRVQNPFKTVAQTKNALTSQKRGL